MSEVLKWHREAAESIVGEIDEMGIEEPEFICGDEQICESTEREAASRQKQRVSEYAKSIAAHDPSAELLREMRRLLNFVREPLSDLLGPERGEDHWTEICCMADESVNAIDAALARLKEAGVE